MIHKWKSYDMHPNSIYHIPNPFLCQHLSQPKIWIIANPSTSTRTSSRRIVTRENKMFPPNHPCYGQIRRRRRNRRCFTGSGRKGLYIVLAICIFVCVIFAFDTMHEQHMLHAIGLHVIPYMMHQGYNANLQDFLDEERRRLAGWPIKQHPQAAATVPGRQPPQRAPAPARSGQAAATVPGKFSRKYWAMIKWKPLRRFYIKSPIPNMDIDPIGTHVQSNDPKW